MNRYLNMAHISPARQRILRFLSNAVFLLLFSLVLQVAGCFSPGWLYMKYGSSGSLHYGLWYARVCGDDTCLTKSTSDFDKATGVTISEIFAISEHRGETISAIVFCIAAIVIFRLCRTRLYSNNVMVHVLLVIGGVLVLLSGILAIIAAGKFGDTTREMADKLTTGGRDISIDFPYSLFITGVGGLLDLIALLVLLASQPWKISTENQQSPPHAPQTVMHPAQFTTIQTANPQGQPHMYNMAAAPTTAPVEKSQDAPSYY